jgi:hypothetical protein
MVTFRDGKTYAVGEAPPVEPGVMITVPEVSVRWYQDYLQILTAVASVVTSYTGLYILLGGRINTSSN